MHFKPASTASTGSVRPISPKFNIFNRPKWLTNRDAHSKALEEREKLHSESIFDARGRFRGRGRPASTAIDSPGTRSTVTSKA
jgi:hypothetical protein